MPLVSLLVVLAVVGVIVYLLETLPITPPFKMAIRVVAILGVALWLLKLIGVSGPRIG